MRGIYAIVRNRRRMEKAMNYPNSDESFARLHRSGWSVGEAGFRALPVPRKSNGFLFSSGLCQPFFSYERPSVSIYPHFHFGCHSPRRGHARPISQGR